MASDPSPVPAPTVGKAELAGLLLRYLDAREALHAANNGAVHKLGVLHQGRAFCVQFGADGITGMAVADYVGDPKASADTTPEAPKRRGRPAKVTDVEKSTETTLATVEGATVTADAPAAPAAPVVEKKPMTKDEYRAYASRAALKLGVPKVREINGGAIDDMDPAVFPAKAAELDAAVKAKEGL